MEKAGAAVVLVEGKPGGMLTRQDVLTYLATRSA
jgi:predicted transcriptional regulator